MTIVSTPPQPAGAASVLEVVALGVRDVAGAEEGGADRLLLVVRGEQGGMSPPPDVVAAVCAETDLPVRVVLRLRDDLTTTGGELNRLIGLATDYLARGADGVVMGFLDHDLDVDVEITGAILERVPGLRWTFSRAIDHSLDQRRAWRALLGQPGLDAVATAGSTRGLEHGYEDLLGRVRSDPRIAALAMPSGGLTAEQVPWLVRAGVRQLHLGAQVRPTRSYDKANVDAALVRSWRRLLDDEVAAARR